MNYTSGLVTGLALSNSSGVEGEVALFHIVAAIIGIWWVCQIVPALIHLGFGEYDKKVQFIKWLIPIIPCFVWIYKKVKELD